MHSAGRCDTEHNRQQSEQQLFRRCYSQPRLALHILRTRHSNSSNNQQLDYWQWQHAIWRRDLYRYWRTVLPRDGVTH